MFYAKQETPMITNKITPISQNNYTPCFSGFKLTSQARENIVKNLPELGAAKFGTDDLKSFFTMLENIKMDYLEIMSKKPQKRTCPYSDVDVVLHEIKIQPSTGEKTYIYSIPKLGKGAHAIYTKQSIMQKPIAIYKQILQKSCAEDKAFFKSFQ